MIKVYHNPNFLNDCLRQDSVKEISLSNLTLVANIDVHDLESAFTLSQNEPPRVNWLSNPGVYCLLNESGVRSTSWGDFFEINGKVFMVLGIGFKEVVRIDYFKQPQRDGIYHYYKVFGGEGKIAEGYQEVINFLNSYPIISIERNFDTDPSGVSGTWDQHETGIAITKAEYDQAYREATGNPDFTIL